MRPDKRRRWPDARSSSFNDAGRVPRYQGEKGTILRVALGLLFVIAGAIAVISEAQFAAPPP